MDDATVGRAIRALRIKRGWRQVDLADLVGLSQSLVSRAERGHLDSLSIRSVRAMFAALDAGCTLTPWWRSGQLERLLDEEHAALTARAVELLKASGWDVNVEVTFSIYRESGSIDVLGTKPAQRRALMVEVKPSITSTEELNRTSDRKTRLLPQIVSDRLGWRPTTVGRLLVVADTSTNRRRVERARVFEAVYPIRAGEARAWLRGIGSPGSALVFLATRTVGTARRLTSSPQRVRTRRPRTQVAISGRKLGRSGAQ